MSLFITTNDIESQPSIHTKIIFPSSFYNINQVTVIHFLLKDLKRLPELRAKINSSR